MIVGVDTDILVNWMMAGASHHTATQALLDRLVRGQGCLLGVAPQVLFEFVHICTDPRRFQNPFSMEEALQVAKRIWSSREVAPIQQGMGVLHRTLDLMERLRLGRKRILDTALAVTLSDAGVKKLATLNGRDYAIFSFLEIIAPA